MLNKLLENEKNVKYDKSCNCVFVKGTDWTAIRISNKLAENDIKSDEFWYDEDMEDYVIPLQIT